METKQMSMVSITMTVEAAGEILRRARTDENGALTYLLEEETTEIRRTDTDYVIFFWDSVFWDEWARPEVAQLESYLKEECGGNYSFIRIGEAFNDIEETDGDAFENDEETPYIYRTIVVPDLDLENEAEGD